MSLIYEAPFLTKQLKEQREYLLWLTVSGSTVHFGRNGVGAGPGNSSYCIHHQSTE